MKRMALGVAALTLAGLGFAAAQGGFGTDQRPSSAMSGGFTQRFTPEDREAFLDARIAAVHAGLKLGPDQEKLWPPVEQAVRGLVELRRQQRRAWHDRPGPETFMNDVPGALRAMADAQAARADGLRKLADALAPLYSSLDDGQRRRLLILARPLRGRFGGMHGMHGMHGGGMHGGGMHGGGMQGGMDGTGRRPMMMDR